MDRRTMLSLSAGGLLAAFSPWTASADGPRKLLGYIRTNWSRDPFSLGSYSYIAKGARRRDYRRFQEPIGNRVFFAGEAAHAKRHSTVHAAHESGLHAARNILDTNASNIAIVGAGMSGLSAAKALSDEGLQVTVFEGRDRIGGRIWTDDRLGVPLDLGASWIHGINNNPLIALSDTANQIRIPTDDTYITRGKDGKIIPDTSAPSWLEPIASIQHTAGADPDQINNRAYFFSSDYGGKDVKFRDGYADIFNALSGDYHVKLLSTVTHITYDDQSVSVTITNDYIQTFDAVIITLPLGVLKEGKVQFNPPLPDTKQSAIENLGMGTLDKVYLLFESPFWDKDASWILTPQNNLPQGQFNQWLNLNRYINEPVIMAFNGGTPALDLAELPDKVIVEGALQTLSLAYPL